MISTRKMSLAGAAVAALVLGTGAAYANIVTTGGSGYWTAGQGPNDIGQNVCMISTNFPNQAVGITTNNADQRFHVVAFKPSWNIPSNAGVSMTFQIDGNPVWGGPQYTVPGSKAGLVLAIAPEGAREFVHQITSGSVMRIYFSGNEQPWVMNLSGTTGVWSQFMNCAQMVAPAVVASLTPTQPFNSVAPTQPSVAPSTQPFVTGPTQPVGPAPRREFGV